MGDKYEAVLKDNNLHVKAALNITVEGNSTIYTKQDCALQVDESMEQIVGGDLTMNGWRSKNNHRIKRNGSNSIRLN